MSLRNNGRSETLWSVRASKTSSISVSVSTLFDIVNVNKTLTKFLADIEDHATTGETPSYSVRLIISQVRTKCEKLIEIDNYLQVKMQMLARLFQKHGSLAQGDCEVSLEDM
jgi:chromosome segregation ATPase